jgi:dTDP-4-dehydrorhamnose reductase
MKWLVLGARGLLGSEVVRYLKNQNCDVTAAGHCDLDITNETLLRDAVRQHDVVVNCAAFVNVDTAQKQCQRAYAVNAAAVHTLGQTCVERGVQLVHISTNYVFDGMSPAAYPTWAQRNPISVYGSSKLGGELAIAQTCGIIIRVGWLYGPGKITFVDSIFNRLNRRESVMAVKDPIGTPTPTRLVAQYVYELVRQGQCTGVFHVAPKGSCTIYEMASLLADGLGVSRDCITTAFLHDLYGGELRPRNGVLSINTSQISNVNVHSWQSYLTQFLATRTNN